MTKRQTSQYEVLVGSRQFGEEYRDQFPESSEGGLAFAAIDAAVKKFEALSVSKDKKRHEGKRLKVTSRSAVHRRLRAIARNARVLGKRVPGAESKFYLPVRQSDVAVLTTAKAFLQELPAVKASLINCGLPGTFVEDLQKDTDSFEQAMSDRRLVRVTKRSHDAGIKEALRLGFDALRSLDVLVANIFGDDAETMTKWKTLRRVASGGRPAAVGAPPVVELGVPLDKVS